MRDDKREGYVRCAGERLRKTFQDKDKTLTDKQIDKIMKKLQQGFEREFKAELR